MNETQGPVEWGDERLPERFWSKVNPVPTESGCWEWTGSTRRRGYGQFTWQGRNLVATRVAYSGLVGPVREDLLVRHKCDNPPCVNPGHLELGTALQNSQDMVDRGRQRSGNSNVRACPRGHALENPNLVPSTFNKGRRDCLACARARANVRNSAIRHGVKLDFQDESNRHYSLIMGGTK